MTKSTAIKLPYKPFFIHALDDLLEKMPIPAWALFTLVFLVVGIAQHLVAWAKGALAPGQLNLHLGTAGYWLVITFLVFHYALQGAEQALEQYRPLLDLTEEEYAHVKYRFLTIPRSPGTVLFILGIAIGSISGFADMAEAPAIDYVFPQLRIGIWIAATGLVPPFIFHMIRQLEQIRALYAMPEHLDLYNLRPLYGFSRYTAVLGIAFIISGTLLPGILDPTSFSGRFVLTTDIALSPLILLMFYLPLTGVHGRLVTEKDRLLEEVNTGIAMIREQIHAAVLDKQGYEHLGEMRTVFSTLREDKETIDALPTWPWRPGTLTGLLSALLLPILLIIVREVLSMLLGL